MNANELADDAKNISNTIEALEFVQKAVPMLRQFGLAESIIKQQQIEIEALKKQNADMNRRLLGWDIYEQ
jgi:hypothetical protein